MAVAVDLGDAGEALDVVDVVDVVDEIDPSGLSPERQAHLLIDIARAHAQRRHIADATATLLEAERLAPEQIRAHAVVSETVADLLGQSGRRPSTELADLARRIEAA